MRIHNEIFFLYKKNRNFNKNDFSHLWHFYKRTNLKSNFWIKGIIKFTYYHIHISNLFSFLSIEKSISLNGFGYIFNFLIFEIFSMPSIIFFNFF